MEKKYYTSGEFAKRASITIRTVRYYDKQGLLKPSYINAAGYRMYTDEDFVKLQKILALKYLGFSLEEIRTMTIHDTAEDMKKSLQLQLRLIKKKKEHLEQVEEALEQASTKLEEEMAVHWDEILHLIHMTNMERVLVEQYKTAANLDIRIQLHHKYSNNKTGWFPWLYRQLPIKESGTVLELGCGNGQLWKSREEGQLSGKDIWLTDVSSGMVQDAKENLKMENWKNIHFKTENAQSLTFPDKCMDLIIANHVLFYVKSLPQTLTQVQRVLRPDGVFCCSTYGQNHMKEITRLVKEFDSRITLSQVQLWERFGIENGKEIAGDYFKNIEYRPYEDGLTIRDPEPLLDYILSCHGNQRELLLTRCDEFRTFLLEKIKKQGAIHITKEAGIFLCRLK